MIYVSMTETHRMLETNVFFNQKTRDNMSIFDEFPLPRANKYINATFKVVMSEEKINKETTYPRINYIVTSFATMSYCARRMKVMCYIITHTIAVCRWSTTLRRRRISPYLASVLSICGDVHSCRWTFQRSSNWNMSVFLPHPLFLSTE